MEPGCWCHSFRSYLLIGKTPRLGPCRILGRVRQIDTNGNLLHKPRHDNSVFASTSIKLVSIRVHLHPRWCRSISNHQTHQAIRYFLPVRSGRSVLLFKKIWPGTCCSGWRYECHCLSLSISGCMESTNSLPMSNKYQFIWHKTPHSVRLNANRRGLIHALISACVACA